MDTLKVLDQVRELLQQKGRITYRILKLQFKLDDEHETCKKPRRCWEF